MYIITYSIDLENQKNYEIIIEPPAGMSNIFEAAKEISFHRYRLEYINHHEIVCPRYILQDGTDVIVIPWFLIPGRPYPIQVYLYACSLYCSNPEFGQRKVAEHTRKKFNLKKFSHSTVSRSFKSLEKSREQALEGRFGQEHSTNTQTQHHTGNDVATETEEERLPQSPQSERLFPSVKETAVRRKNMSSFLKKFRKTARKKNITKSARLYVKHFHKKTQQLLLSASTAPVYQVNLQSKKKMEGVDVK